MVKKMLVVFLALTMLVSASACGTSATAPLEELEPTPTMMTAPVPTPMPPVLPETDPVLAEQSVKDLEAQLHSQWEGQIHYEDVSLKELDEAVNTFLESEDVSVEGAVFTMQSPQPQISVREGARFLAPVLVFSTQAFEWYTGVCRATFGENLSNPAVLHTMAQWLAIHHWMNHLGDLGINVFNLGAGAEHVHAVISAAYAGEGAILYRQATESLQEAWLFIAKIGDEWWVVLVDRYGSPITTFNANRSLAKYSVAKINQGYRQIDPDGVPNEIADVWVKGVPPVIQIWYWMMRYQITRAIAAAKAARVTAAVVNLVNVFYGIAGYGTSDVLLVPTFMFVDPNLVPIEPDC